jgi:hypothetical protein
LTGTSDE